MMAADWPRDAADGDRAKRRKSAGRRIEVRKEQIAEHQRDHGNIK